MKKIINNPKKKCGIYKITSPNGAVYIGATTNLQTRIWYYQSLDCKGQRRLYASFLEHGWVNHKVEMVHELPKDCTKNIFHTYEELYIRQYQCNYSDYPEFNGLNMTNGKYSISPYTTEMFLLKRSGGNSNFFGLKGDKHPHFGKRGKDAPGYGNKGNLNSVLHPKMMGLTRGKNPFARKVINIETGEIYDCCVDAAEAFGLTKGALAQQFKRKKYHTPLRYYDEY